MSGGREYRDAITATLTAHWQGRIPVMPMPVQTWSTTCSIPRHSAQPVAVPVIDDQTPLPSYDQPSDHLALMAHFNWH